MSVAGAGDFIPNPFRIGRVRSDGNEEEIAALDAALDLLLPILSAFGTAEIPPDFHACSFQFANKFLGEGLILRRITDKHFWGLSTWTNAVHQQYMEVDIHDPAVNADGEGVAGIAFELHEKGEVNGIRFQEVRKRDFLKRFDIDHGLVNGVEFHPNRRGKSTARRHFAGNPDENISIFSIRLDKSCIPAAFGHHAQRPDGLVDEEVYADVEA